MQDKAIIYVDNNATTAVAPEVVEAMMPYLQGHYFNPSSMYSAAEGPEAAIKAARKSIARFLNAGSDKQLIFSSCATESNNAAIFGVANANPKRKHIITSAVEHPAVLEVCKEMERRGYELTYLEVDKDGQIDMVDYIKALRPDTLLVSLMHANNETGVIFPIGDMARLAKETNPQIVFHTDATQTVGKLAIDLKGELKHVDLLTFSGHKLHAPKGVGALFVRRGTPWRPFLIGGHQEEGRRAGTQNVAFIVALAKACELAQAYMPREAELQALRDHLQARVLAEIPWVEVNGLGAPRLANTLNLAFHYIEGESILYQLDDKGICASSGSACTSGSLEPSHVLRAMKVPFTAMHGSIRFSLSRYTTAEEVEEVAQVLPELIISLRKLSPYWDSERQCPREDVAMPVAPPA